MFSVFYCCWRTSNAPRTRNTDVPALTFMAHFSTWLKSSSRRQSCCFELGSSRQFHTVVRCAFLESSQTAVPCSPAPGDNPRPTRKTLFFFSVTLLLDHHVGFMGAFHCKSCQNGEDVANIFGGQHADDSGERRRFIFGRHRSRSGSVKQTDSLVLQTLSVIKNLGLFDK